MALLAKMFLGAKAGFSKNPASFIVSVGRGLYFSSLSGIGVFWYTGWRRERVQPGQGSFPIPGLTKLKAQYKPSLADKALPSDTAPTGISPTGTPTVINPAVNPPGATPAGSKDHSTKHENFDPIRYMHRLHTAQKIANQFRLHITSGHRTAQHNAEVGGVPGSLHVDGLAFDFVGSATDMARAQRWAQAQPNVFSEVLVHNVGSGIHLHLGFWPGAGL